MPKGFNVTFETITPESARDGDVEDRGFLGQNLSLRDALDIIDGPGEGEVEADSYPMRLYPPRWLTFYKIREDYTTGETENRSLHIPDRITAASRMRIARLVGCYGVPAKRID